MTTDEKASTEKQHIGFAKDIAFVAIANVIVSILQFLRLPILTKWLDDTSLFGTWSLIWVTITIVAYIATLGFSISTVRLLAAEKDKDKIRDNFYSIFLIVLAAGALLALLLTLGSNIFASSILDDAGNSPLVKLASVMIITQSLSQISFVFFRTFRQMKYYSGLTAGKAIAEIGLLLVFRTLGWDIEGVIIAFIISGALSIGIALIITIRQIGFKFPRFTQMKSYLKYGLPLVPGTLVMWIIHSSDRYMIEHFAGLDEAGIYSGAYSLSNLIGIFVLSLGMVLLPTVSKSYDNNELDKTKRYLKYSLKYMMMLSIPAAFGLSIMATPLLQIVTTNDYTPGNAVIPYVTAGLVVFSAYQVCIYSLYLTKKTFWILGLPAISATINVLLNLLLIPHLGIIGAAVATLVSYGILGILTVIISFRYLKFNISVPFLIKSLFASAIMAVVIWIINPADIVQVILSIIVGIVIYMSVLFLSKGLSKKEFSLFKNLIESSIKGKNNDVESDRLE